MLSERNFKITITAFILLIFGLILATVATEASGNQPNPALNLSHIECLENGQIEAHFVLVHSPGTGTPSQVTFGWTPLGQTNQKNLTGSTWHFRAFFSSGTNFNLSWAFVNVPSWWPGPSTVWAGNSINDYNGEYDCSEDEDPTATPTNTEEPTSTNTPTATATATNTDVPTATPTNTDEPTATPTFTDEPTFTPTFTEVPPTATPTEPPCEFKPIYRMMALVDSDAPDWYWGTGARNGSCWVILHNDSDPGVSVERQANICSVCAFPDFVYEADRVAYDGYVYMNCEGEIRYGDAMWETEWFRSDYDNICRAASCLSEAAKDALSATAE